MTDTKLAQITRFLSAETKGSKYMREVCSGGLENQLMDALRCRHFMIEN